MAARRNTELYKRYGHLLQYDPYQLLATGDTEQGQWQAIQFVSSSGREAVVLAFRAESPHETVQLLLQGLRIDGIYEVNFANRSDPDLEIGGGDLLSKGIAVSLERPHMSEVVSVRML
jgi:hypothetical protein